MNISNYHFFELDNHFYCFNCFNYRFLELKSDEYYVIKDYLSTGKYNYAIYEKEDIKSAISTIRKNRDFFADEVVFREGFSNQQMIFSFCPVHKCNLNCVYCFAQQKKDKEYYENININILEKIFKFIDCHYSNYDNYRIEFVSGGEPLLNWDMVKSGVNLAKKYLEKKGKNFSVLLVTNATKLDAEKLDFVFENSIKLCISIDGEKKLHDLQRPMKNGDSNYDIIYNTLDGIKRNHKYIKPKDIWAVSVLTSHCHDIKNIIQNNIELGFGGMELRIARGNNGSIFLNKNNVGHFEDLYKNLYKNFCKCIETEDYSKIRFILNEYDYFGKILYRLLNGSKIKYRCNAGKNKIAFTANGDIYPCDSFVGNKAYYMGNVCDNTIDKKIEQQFLLASVENNEQCSICRYKYLCSGDCYYNSEVNFGNIFTVNEEYCRLMNVICDLAIKLYIKMYTKNHTEFLLLKDYVKKMNNIK